MTKATQQQKHYKILLIGDSCTDTYIYGKCDRLSPEAPIPIFEETYQDSRPGMSANVRENFLGLGCQVTHITNENEIKKIRMIDDRFNQHILRIDENPQVDYLNVDFLSLNEDISSKHFDAIVFSDYDKGFLKYTKIKNIISYIRKNWSNVPIFVDTKKTDIDCYKNVIFKINEHEFKNIINKGLKNPESEWVVTHGKDGAYWNNIHFPSYRTEVYDVCGAGDTFLAGLVYMYIDTNCDMSKSIEFANKCAAIAVRNFGTHSISLKEVSSE